MKEEIIRIIGFMMEPERAECKADEIIEAIRNSGEFVPMETYNEAISYIQELEGEVKCWKDECKDITQELKYRW